MIAEMVSFHMPAGTSGEEVLEDPRAPGVAIEASMRPGPFAFPADA